MLSQTSQQRRCNTASDFRATIKESPKKEVVQYLVRKHTAYHSQMVSNNHRYPEPVTEATETYQTQREKPNLVLQALTENDSVTSP